MSIREAAIAALRTQEAAEQDQVDQETVAERSEYRRRAQERLAGSQLLSWFPGSKWVLHDWDLVVDAPIMRPDPDEPGIRLMILEDGIIRAVELDFIRNLQDVQAHPVRRQAREQMPHNKEIMSHLRHHKLWWGPVATSAADVGRMVRHHEERIETGRVLGRPSTRP